MIDRIDLRTLNETHCVNGEEKKTHVTGQHSKKQLRRVVMLRIELVFRNDYD